MKTLIAIPSYRCEKQIRRVLAALAKLRPQIPEVTSVIVFDNQSPDSTVQQAQEQVRIDHTDDWIFIKRNERNVGLGGTHKIAFDWAREHRFSHIIVFHGDDQGEVTEIPKIIDELKKDYDAVLGSRFMSGSRRLGYSRLRICGNHLLNFAYSLLTFKKIEDLGSGLNGFRVEALVPKTYLSFSNQFTFNMDLLLNLVGRRARICFVPITWKEWDQISNARNFLVGREALKTLIFWRFGWVQKRVQDG